MSAIERRDDAVAVVGIGCRFPGGVVDPDSFWRLLVDARDAIEEVPGDRFDVAGTFDPTPARAGKMLSRRGGFVGPVDRFDAAFFSISPREAERIDPQQRLLLETSWEALEDAGIDPTSIAGTGAGVYVGQWTSDFESRMFADLDEVDFYAANGSGRYASSGRLSFVLGATGPSMTIDTACSSSLVALHLAVRSIRRGESPLAIVGGANLILAPYVSVAYSQSRMMAPDGACKFGSARADGYVRSEGVACVVLKPLARALDDGDRVYCVIRGTAVNSDGRSSGMLGRPSRTGQEAMLRAALADAGIAGADVAYVEAHGTGTRVGDPVELSALGTVLARDLATTPRALVGSVKSNIGHTEAAAGLAGLIKVALALRHGTIPASLHCEDPNPTVPWATLPLAMASMRADWPREAGRRFACVSSYGISGTNAHAVLQDVAPAESVGPGAQADCTRSDPGKPWFLVASARGEEALKALVRQLAARVAAASPRELERLCAASLHRRAALEHRAAVVAGDRESLARALDALATGHGAGSTGAVPPGPPPRIVFVFPGQGGQWPGMAKGLLDAEPVFREAVAACDRAASPWLDWSIAEVLGRTTDPARRDLDRVDVVQPVLLTVEIAYARWLLSKGVVPDAVVGHSMGEVAAAHLAGALDLAQAMRIVCRRSALMRACGGDGAMAMVELSAERLDTRLRDAGPGVTAAAYNSPRASVVSGDADAVARLVDALQAEGVFARRIDVDVASHSPKMDRAAAALADELRDLAASAPATTLMSTVTGRTASAEDLDGAYWGRNLREPVRFAACIERLAADGPCVFVELGPHPVLLHAIGQSVPPRPGSVAPGTCCGLRDEDPVLAAWRTIADLWCVGARLDPAALVPRLPHADGLPTYPWQRERHWAAAADAPGPGRGGSRDGGRRLAHPEWLHAIGWRPAEDEPGAPSVARPAADGIVVVGTAATLGEVEAAFARRHGGRVATAAWDDRDATARAVESVGARRLMLWADDRLPAFAPAAVLQAVAAMPRAQRPRIWLVTRGAQCVADAEAARVSIAQAAAWGAARVLAEESPDAWGGLIDLDADGEPVDRVDAAIAASDRVGRELEQAVRGGRVHVPRLASLDVPARGPSYAWRHDGAYLITGGLGAIGLRLAARMIASGVRRVVLMGRSPLPPRDRWGEVEPGSADGIRIGAVRGLEAQGAAVHLLTADVADRASLEAALAAYRREAWPPIVGVIHAAGDIDARLGEHVDAALFDRVARGKLLGAVHLDALLPDAPVFVACSSLMAVLGMPGLSAYAAANAGLDALVRRRRARGLHAVSVRWGPWAGTGMVGGADAGRRVGDLEALGVGALAADDAAGLLDTLLACDEPSPIVASVDWGVFAAKRLGRDRATFAPRFPVGPGGEARDDPTTRLAAAATARERRALLEPIVRDAVSRVLGLPARELDPRRELGTLGLNSLLAMELRNRLEAALGRGLSATLAWNHPTVEAMVAFLAAGDDDEPDPDGAPATDDPVLADRAPGLPDLSNLTDDEAVDLLRRRH